MAAKQVIIKGDPLQKEGIANEAITPGHLLERVTGSAATAGQLKKHSTAGGNQNRLFAVEQDYIGQGLSKAYASGDQVIYVVARTGDEINALIKASENVGVDSLLESAGDGTLRVHIPQSNVGSGNVLPTRIVGRALDPTNVGSVARCRVEVA